MSPFYVSLFIVFIFRKSVVNNTSIDEIRGSEGQLLTLLSKKLNFDLNLQEFVDIPDIWKSMVDAVRDKKVDWAVAGITSSQERMKIADFTHFIRPEPYTALYCIYEDIWMSWENILMPFEMAVWIVLAMTTTLIAFLLYLSIKVTHEEEKLGLAYYMQVRSVWLAINNIYKVCYKSKKKYIFLLFG